MGVPAGSTRSNVLLNPLPPPPPVDPTKANVSWYSIHDHANNVNYVGQVYVYPSEGSYSDVSTREIAGYPKTVDDYMKQNYTNTNSPYYYDYEGTASNFKNFLFLEVTDFGFSIAPVSEVPPYVANGTQLAIVLKDSSWTKVQ